ncbi:MAG: ftsH 3 [Firmicutes bacterium]|nr:ftsH 3 [Bacillota bacterium]
MRLLECGLGVAGGIMIYFIWQGVNLWPVFFIAGMAGILFYFGNARSSGGKSFAVFDKPKDNIMVSFDDIGGQDVAKNELLEALNFIANVEGIRELGIRPLKGLLLNGPPGTGKTLLAKAAAQFTNSAFVAASGSEFVEMYVGVGAQRVRQLFKQAKILAKKQDRSSAVIFIDEIEVLGGKRGQNSGHLEYDQTLNELLVQMDGMSDADDFRILVIGATNRIDMLDPALLRPGRFDRQVQVDLPDKAGRLHILNLHTRNKPLAPEVSLEELAKATFGFSGAHLESLVNEAAIMALREDSKQVKNEHLIGAIDKVIMGEKLERLPGQEEKRRIAVHEAGHAVVSELVQPGSVASVNVSARGKALGYVRQAPPDDMYLYTSDFLQARIAVALAGAIAEEIVLGNRSTGAASDFQQAADLARKIVYGGMSEIGIISPDDLPKEALHSAIVSIFRDMESKVKTILLEYQAMLLKTVDVLLVQECISGEKFRSLLDGKNADKCA